MDKHNQDFPEQEWQKLQEQLHALDDKLILPKKLQPTDIDLKKKKYWGRTFIAIAASLLVLLGSAYFIRDYLNTMNIREANREIKNLTAGSSTENETSYSKLKDLFLAFQKKEATIYEQESNFIGSEGGSIEKKSMNSAVMEDKANTGNRALGEASDEVSTTNNQVDGVEEADIVQTNGEYIFSSRSTYDYNTVKNTIHITSTLRTGKMEEVGKIELSANLAEMFLKDNHLVLITNPEMVYYEKETNKPISQEEYYQKSGSLDRKKYEEFSLKYRPYESTKVLIYDVTQPSKPVLKRSFSQEGYYGSSRLIGNNLYLISNKTEYEALRYSELKATEIGTKDIVPLTKDSADNDEITCIAEKSIQLAPNPASYGFTIVSGLNISNNKPASTKAYLGGSSEIYATKDTLYILSGESDYGSNTRINPLMDRIFRINKTHITKYALKDAVPKKLAKGEVLGGILNQFSVDEYDGYFRVATTIYPENNKKKQTNNLYILDKNLKLVGSLTNLAPGEDIHSARFIEDKGYLVTFREIDPLFAFDLSDPRNPKVLGKLKIPGFSDYMHPYKDHYLIGIGHDTKSNGHGGVTRSAMKLSLFDVSDPSNPKEIHKLIFGNETTSSEVLYNHKAFLFSESKNLFGFPVNQYSVREEQYEKETSIAARYYVFSVDIEKGFKIEKKYFSNSEENQIHRGLYVDDVLYLVANDNIAANSLKDFSEIKNIRF